MVSIGWHLGRLKGYLGGAGKPFSVAESEGIQKDLD